MNNSLSGKQSTETALVSYGYKRLAKIEKLEEVKEVFECVWNIIAVTKAGRRLFLKHLYQFNRPQLHHVTDYALQFPAAFVRI